MPLTEYEVTWNGAVMPIQEAIRQISNGTFPDDLSIYHPRFGSITVSRPGYEGADSDYTVSRTGPSPFGRGGLARSNATRPLSEESLLSYIHETFSELARDLAVLNSARAKMLRMQVEASKKMANQYEASTGKSVPREMRNTVAGILGEKPAVPGAYSVLDNLSKISTNLFQGGKRKTRKTRKSKKTKKTKSKRSHRKITRRRR